MAPAILVKHPAIKDNSILREAMKDNLFFLYLSLLRLSLGIWMKELTQHLL